MLPVGCHFLAANCSLGSIVICLLRRNFAL
jgi:hypothetical protein